VQEAADTSDDAAEFTTFSGLLLLYYSGLTLLTERR